LRHTTLVVPTSASLASLECREKTQMTTLPTSFDGRRGNRKKKEKNRKQNLDSRTVTKLQPGLNVRANYFCVRQPEEKGGEHTLKKEKKKAPLRETTGGLRSETPSFIRPAFFPWGEKRKKDKEKGKGKRTENRLRR